MDLIKFENIREVVQISKDLIKIKEEKEEETQ